MFKDFYGLSATPFRLAPDPDFFYESACHKRGLAYLRYGLQQSQGFVVVTGIPGTGKSLLVQKLFSELSGRRMVVAVLNNPNLGEHDILRAVANCFDIHYPDDNKAGLLGAIERFLISQRRQSKHVLLIVDEAQNLPKKSLEELRMLTNFQLGENALMQIMLLGQQQLQQMLADPTMEQLAQRVIATCHLAPLNAEDTRAYIEHRLRRVGWQGRPSFSGEALQLIHHFSRGIPRLTNNLCDRLLLAACIEQKEDIDAAHLNMVIKELREESSGAWRKASFSAVVDLPPLPDGEFVPSAPIAPSLPDVQEQLDLPASTDAMQEERMVTPCYDYIDEESAKKKKGLLNFGRSKDKAPGSGPAELLEEASFKEKPISDVPAAERDDAVVIPCYEPREDEHPSSNRDVRPKTSQAIEEIFSSDRSTPAPEMTAAPVAGSLTPDPVQFKAVKKGRWWLMPVVAGIVVVAGMALFIVFADGETRKFVEKMLPSSISLPQRVSADFPQTPEQKETSTAPAVTADPASETPQSLQMPVQPVTGNQRQIQAAAPVFNAESHSTAPAAPRLVRSLQRVVPPENDLALPPIFIAPAEPVVANDAPPFVPQEIYDYELPDLVYSFAFAYDNGDLERFVDLFSDDAFLDDSYGRQKIEREYRKIFQATDVRNMKVKEVAWQSEGEKARGDGVFDLTVWRHGDAKPSNVKGKINIEVVKEKERLYIKKLSLVAE